MAERAKSPLKSAPLRVAGQSLSDQIIDNAFDTMVAPYAVAVLLIVLAALEWWRYYLKVPLSPWLYTGIAACGAAWATVKIVRGLSRAKSLRLGRDGERAVAQYLEWFRQKDFFVFHDVPTGDANIDHVLIGPRGLYVIETKTLSKPVRGQCRISVNTENVTANGHALDRNPITQAKAQARWLFNFLGESGFKRFVQPVVVFPGWFVDPFDMKAIGVWAIEPKALDGFIENQAVSLSHDEVRAISSALSSFIRSQSKL